MRSHVGVPGARNAPPEGHRRRLWSGALLVLAVGLLSLPGGRPTVAAEANGANPGNGGRPPFSLREVIDILNAEGKKPRFDGSVAGWRVATYARLKDAGVGAAKLQLNCEPALVGEEQSSDLDFVVGYLPADANAQLVDGPLKWVCGTQGLVVSQTYSVQTSLGVGEIWIERSVQAEPVLELDVAADSVEALEINGHPVVAVHPADDTTGLGYGFVAVIEKDGEPQYQLLKVGASNAVSYAELLKIVEGIR
jgi:hypothetical protein